MSSGQKAAAEAEDDWYALVNEHDPKRLLGNDPYSDEARLAREGLRLGHTGAVLIAFVKWRMAQTQLEQEFTRSTNEAAHEFAQFAKLSAKFS